MKTDQVRVGRTYATKYGTQVTVQGFTQHPDPEREGREVIIWVKGDDPSGYFADELTQEVEPV